MPVVLEVCCPLSNEHVLPNRFPGTKSPEQIQTPDLAIMRYPGACREERGRLFDRRTTRATGRGHASISRKSRVTDTEDTTMLSGITRSTEGVKIGKLSHTTPCRVVAESSKETTVPEATCARRQGLGKPRGASHGVETPSLRRTSEKKAKNARNTKPRDVDMGDNMKATHKLSPAGKGVSTQAPSSRREVTLFDHLTAQNSSRYGSNWVNNWNEMGQQSCMSREAIDQSLYSAPTDSLDDQGCHRGTPHDPQSLVPSRGWRSPPVSNTVGATKRPHNSPTNPVVASRNSRPSEIPKPGKQKLGPRKKKLSSLKKRILLYGAEKWRQLSDEMKRSATTATPRDTDAPPAEIIEADASSQPLDLLNSTGSHSKASQGACERQEGDKSPTSAGAATCDPRVAAGDDCLMRHPEITSPSPTRVWDVAIKNLVNPEDVEDDDEYQEIFRDVRDMVSHVEGVQAIHIPRLEEVDVGTVTVVIASAKAAQEACAWFHGRVIGGKALEAGLVPEDHVKTEGTLKATGREQTRCMTYAGDDAEASKASPRSPKPPTQASPSPEKRTMLHGDEASSVQAAGEANVRLAGKSSWQVLVRNLIEEDDLEDDDNFEEVCSDVSGMVGIYGDLLALEIPRQARDSSHGWDVGDVVATFGSLAEAKACARGMRGRRVAGKDLHASVLSPWVSEAASGSLMPVGGAGERSSGSERNLASTQGVGPVEGVGALEGRAVSLAQECSRWWVVVKDLIDEEDLEDDDGYEEVAKDVRAMAEAFGSVVGVHIPRLGDHGWVRVGEAAVSFASSAEAGACAAGMEGRRVGGRSIHTVLRSPSGDGGRSAAGHAPGSGDARSYHDSSAKSAVDRASGTIELMPGTASDIPVHVAGKSDSLAGPDLTVCHRNAAVACDSIGADISGASSGPPVVDTPHACSATGYARVDPTPGKRPMRIPERYREAAALPKPPNPGGGAPNAYVDQPPDAEVDAVVTEMLQLLFKYQERARIADSLKARIRRRLVMGLREVLRGVRAKKVRLVIVAPNVDAMKGEGGLDEKVMEIVNTSREVGIPVIFALSKRRIGRALGKTVKVSVVGVYSFDGAHEQWRRLEQRLQAIRSGLSASTTRGGPSSDP